MSEENLLTSNVNCSEWVWYEEWSPATIDGPAECIDAGWYCKNCFWSPNQELDLYFDNPEEKPKDVKVFIAKPEITTFVLWDWIEWLGEENYEDWAITVYDEIMKNPITNEFILLVNKVFKDHPTYYPGQKVEIDIPSPRCGYGSKTVNELCSNCIHKDVFWKNAGCNLKNGMEPCKFEPKEK